MCTTCVRVSSHVHTPTAHVRAHRSCFVYTPRSGTHKTPRTHIHLLSRAPTPKTTLTSIHESPALTQAQPVPLPLITVLRTYQPPLFHFLTPTFFHTKAQTNQPTKKQVCSHRTPSRPHQWRTGCATKRTGRPRRAGRSGNLTFSDPNQSLILVWPDLVKMR